MASSAGPRSCGEEDWRCNLWIWFQYFCCTLVANREFARNLRVATRRGLRALEGDGYLCLEPDPAVHIIVDGRDCTNSSSD